jgi:hypothetical protein
VYKTIRGIIKHLRETEDVRVVNAKIGMNTTGDEHACSANIQFWLVGKYEEKQILVDVNTHFTQVRIDQELNYGIRVMDTISFTITRVTEDGAERIWLYTADEFDDNAHMWNQHTQESEVLEDYLDEYNYWRKEDAIFNPKHP